MGLVNAFTALLNRAQTWTAIGLLAAGGAIGLFYDIFTRGLGMGG